MSDPTRRKWLKSLGGTAVVVGAAGCLGDDADDALDDDDDDTEPTDDDDGENGEVDFPTQTIEMSVPTGPGSGFDLYTRTIAEYIPQHLPNDVDVVVENITGAALTRHLRHMEEAEPDGYTIGMTSNSTFTQSYLLGQIDFGPEAYDYLGRLAVTTGMVGARADTDIYTPTDIEESDEEIRWAAGTPGNLGNVHAHLIKDELDDPPLNIITGFDDVGEQAAAVVRGDAELCEGSTTSALRTPVRDGEIRPILVFSTEPYDGAMDLTDAPTLADMGWEEFESIRGFNRMFVVPTGVPDERRTILEEAIYDAAHDEEFLADMEEQEAPIHYADAEATREEVMGMKELFEENIHLLEG